MFVQIKRHILTEITVRLILWLLFLWLDHQEPFIRIIKSEELWLYQYPAMASYVPARLLWFIVFFIPSIFILSEYTMNKNSVHLRETVLSLSLNYAITGNVTQFFKIIVGRPRPSFYNKCFPDGVGTDFTKCTGNRVEIMDGRKSFPSGHSAYAFSSMVFLSLYLAAKLKIFNDSRGISWRFCVCILPIILASAVAVSRTCDYHHHWQDVLAGSLLGSIVAYSCYRQYFPSLSSAYTHVPYVLHNLTMES